MASLTTDRVNGYAFYLNEERTMKVWSAQTFWMFLGHPESSSVSLTRAACHLGAALRSHPRYVTSLPWGCHSPEPKASGATQQTDWETDKLLNPNLAWYRSLFTVWYLVFQNDGIPLPRFRGLFLFLTMELRSPGRPGILGCNCYDYWEPSSQCLLPVTRGCPILYLGHCI